MGTSLLLVPKLLSLFAVDADGISLNLTKC